MHPAPLQDARRRRAVTMAVIALLAPGVSACAGGEPDIRPTSTPAANPSPSSSTTASTPTPAASPTAEDEERQAASPSGTDDQAYADLVARLGSIAGVYGYGLSRGVPLTGDEAETLAVSATRTCADVLSGASTWQDAIETDIMDGAPPSDAAGFNAFLRDEFCPGMVDLAEAQAGDAEAARRKLPRCPGFKELGAQLSVYDVPGKATDSVSSTMEVRVELTNPEDYPLAVWMHVDGKDSWKYQLFGAKGLEFFSWDNAYRWLRLPPGKTTAFTFPGEYFSSYGLPSAIEATGAMVTDRNTLGRAVDCRS